MRYLKSDEPTFKKCLNLTLKKYNSASSFSGCVHHNKSKCLTTVPTDAEQAKPFEKTLIGGFSCVNTSCVDTQMLLPKNEKDNYKPIYDVKINNIKQKR